MYSARDLLQKNKPLGNAKRASQTETKKNILVIECLWVHACVNGKENISNDANLQ